MNTRHTKRLGSLALVLGLALLVGLAFAPGCSDDTPGGTPDARTDGKAGDGPGTSDGAVKDTTPGDVLYSEGLKTDLPASDGPAPDGLAGDGPADDAGTCVQSGGSCLTSTCCKGLNCCSGVPIPVGQATCYSTCPISDRNLKRDFERVDDSEVLRRVMSLPITRWSYKTDKPGVRHIGPMAQDFKRTFGVGNSKRYIAPLDGTGVSLAAIKALTRAVKRLEAAHQRAKADNARLSAEVRALRRGACSGSKAK
ncbi:MAG: tail fiber domain-containing protein [Myxococcales bacterium]|nr:tail fiber domain-containing protein [Myxococcales bacterium]